MKKIISFLLMTALLLSSAVMTISATETGYDLPFTDLNENAWYMDSVAFCYEMGYVNGMTATKFAPNGTLTRAQFVQILAQFDGFDLSEYEGAESAFDDVKPDHWYSEAVVWAVENGLVYGMSETRFAPNAPITREQLARLLYVYAEYLGAVDITPRNDLSAFDDADKVSAWALECVQWAVEAGIISGMTETAIAPRATATRAQVCRMIEAFFDYMLYGDRDTDGIYRAIADYAVANGETDEELPGFYCVSQETEQEALMLAYEKSMDLILLMFARYPYTEVYEGEEVVDYREYATFSMLGLESSYLVDYSYYGEGEEYVDASLSLEKDGAHIDYLDMQGYDEETARDMVEYAVGRLTAFIEEIIADTEYTIDDLFSEPEPVVRSDAFRRIADHVMTNGELADFEFSTYYELITEAEDKRTCVLYDPEFETLLFSFEADPYEDVIDGESYTSYARGAHVIVEESALEYEYSYYCNVYDYLAAAGGYIGNGTYTEEIFEYDGEETYREAAVMTEVQDRQELVVFINSVLVSCDITPDQFFAAE